MKITEKHLADFEKSLFDEEKAENTISKYTRDVRRFVNFIGDNEITKPLMIEYKNWLKNNYKLSSANSMIAAVNKFMDFAGLVELKLKQFRFQREVYISENRELTKEEYFRLVKTAYGRSQALGLIIESIASTGIRISELKFITVESLAPAEFIVSNKGKSRRVMMPNELCSKLRRYVKENKIKSGSVFVGRNGNPVNRTAIWKQMKALCKIAGINPSKVFPHNLRHLFARCFYNAERDIVKLADVLGHGNINTTHIYLLTTGREHRRILDSLGLIVKTDIVYVHPGG